MADEKNVSFKDTLNLPRTDFPIRANAAQVEAELLARWASQQLYRKTFELNTGHQKYIIPDGPPFANGPIHLGHVYNKVLKDMVAKSQRMTGKQVPITPGWDCHGLPIEHKVMQEHPNASRAEMIAHCRAYATHWIGVQREQFKALGVLMDWDRPYLTMDFSYEAAILEAFGIFVSEGFIERKNKTIPWCASCQTALAAAEIEYKERKDPSIYVSFLLDESTRKKIFAGIPGPVSLVVWTTTPWTLPLNRAVALKPGTVYAVVQLNNDGYGVVAQELVARVAAELGIEGRVLATIPSDQLAGAKVLHPVEAGRWVPVIFDQGVSLQDGTACVHSAPGCGPEDYEMALKNNLEIYSPLTPDGKYAVGIKPEALQGMSITDGQGWVLTHLIEQKRLLHKGSIRHPYPHCWRCRNGLMFRATKQWFLSLSQHGLRERAVAVIEQIAFLPEQSRKSLVAALESRLEWCISRQRVWGVPIPAVLCTACDEVYLTPELIAAVARGVAEQGIEYWASCDLGAVLSHNAKCAACGGSQFKKEQDILDVWFDSGVSHFAVLKRNPALSFPADAYIEGRDQFRGWFQSSLLTSMALEKEPCTRMFLAHGFTVDEKGQKMSKSLGNVVAPADVTKEFGTDVMRMWVASIDYADDAVMSRTLMLNVQEVYRKVRNTARFLLSNVYDFSFESDAVPVTKLLPVDQYALRRLYIFDARVRQAYARADFTAVAHMFADYCASELSATYLDIIKDRLYVEQADGHARQSAQTVCYYMLDSLTHLMAPILSFTAEHIADFYQGAEHESIHMQPFVAVPDILSELSHNAGLRAHMGGALEQSAAVRQVVYDLQWQTLFAVRDAVLKAIEVQRSAGVIKHSLEARLTLNLGGQLRDSIGDLLNHIEGSGLSLTDFLREFFIVSQVVVDGGELPASALPGLSVLVERAHGVKCPRCWQYEISSHEHGLCTRCYEIIKRKEN